MSESKPVVIPEGALLTITCGEYSDYYIEGVFVARAPIDIEELRAEFLNKECCRELDRAKKFLPFIFRKCLLDVVDCYELRLGDEDLTNIKVFGCDGGRK